MIQRKKESREAHTESEKHEFIDTVISVKRVTKVTQGGKRFSFAAFVVSGKHDGSVGIGLGKGREASLAVAKATARARKRLVRVALRGKTLPFDVVGSHGSSRVALRPASQGSGIIAGRAVRAVMMALGVTDVLAKSIGPSRSGQNLVKATLNALAKCRSLGDIARLRNRSYEQIMKGSHHGAQ
jgi:small subunit ribosomal protein S5